MEDRAADEGPRVYVRVAVERGVDAPEGLTYFAEPGLLAVGDRVRVPLGRRGGADGIVIAVGGEELLGDLARARAKGVQERTGSALQPSLVELGRWMSEYYVCPLGMVLATMVPAAVKKDIGRRSREVVDRVEAAVEAALGDVKLPPATREAWGRIEALGRSALPMGAKELAAAVGARTVGPINRLIDAGLLQRKQESVVRVREGDAMLTPNAASTATHELTGEQRRVAEGIGATLGGFGVHLIRGVTGSGKTEVYMTVIDRALREGKTALVLVPEITLTPQTSERFLGRFGSVGVAVLHSALTRSERNRQWSRVLSGEARVVVGARSAVFAPLRDLGVIVVDEEHDTSYKQDQLPRYHARDTAIKRAQIEGATVVLGSATPSLESFHNARSGRAWLWRLDARVGGGRLAPVRIVDLARERVSDSRDHSARLESIGPTLDRELRATLEKGRQAIILLNRRGWASFVACPSGACGWRLVCDDCDATMVVHRGKDLPAGRLVRCHHCQAEKLVPKSCPTCDRKLITLGLGGQRVEEELQRGFGLVSGETLVRVDADTMVTGRDYFEALEGFRSGRVRVLVGTQMIAKGLDFPGVRLVGVISADTSLALPDFRAGERTFQLVSQVAGRAGRTDGEGVVIVQTLNPAEPAIRFAARHDYEGFAELELGIRSRAKLPPATRMARVVCRDKDVQKARALADRVAGLLREGPTGLEVLGPMECAIARVAEHFRFEVQVTAGSAAVLHAALRRIRSVGGIKSDAHTAIDVDPVAML